MAKARPITGIVKKTTRFIGRATGSVTGSGVVKRARELGMGAAGYLDEQLGRVVGNPGKDPFGLKKAATLSFRRSLFQRAMDGGTLQAGESYIYLNGPNVEERKATKEDVDVVMTEVSKWRNPAVSPQQYRLAQAVLSGKSTAMPKKVARELVDQTSEADRSRFMQTRRNSSEMVPMDASGGPTGAGAGPKIYALPDHGDDEYSNIAIGFARGNIDGWRKATSKGKYYGLAWVAEMQDENGRVRDYRIIDAPQPSSINNLFTWLHETAHHYYGHPNKDDLPYHLEEFQATEKALEILNNKGIKVPPKTMEDIRFNVCQAAKKDKKNGIRIERKVEEFCEAGNGKSVNPGHDFGEVVHGKVPIRMNRRANPIDEAASMYEAFHGSPSTEVIEIIEDQHYHSNLAACGWLVGLKFRTPTGYDVTLEFKDVLLTTNEKGTSLYIEGGDQGVDLKAIHMDEFKNKDSIVLGGVWCLAYHTAKDFDKNQPIDYVHGLGPEKYQIKLRKGADLWEDAEPPKETAFDCGLLPTLRYDVLNDRLYLDGGIYKIEKPLVGTSPGIEQ